MGYRNFICNQTWNDGTNVIHQLQIRLPGVPTQESGTELSSRSVSGNEPSPHSLQYISVSTLSWHVDQLTDVVSLSNQIQQLQVRTYAHGIEMDPSSREREPGDQAILLAHHCMLQQLLLYMTHIGYVCYALTH